MATTANVVEAFEDLGFSIDDAKAIDRLVSCHFRPALLVWTTGGSALPQILQNG
jgi:hypothetical protein